MDIYRLKIDAEKQCCYTCVKEGKCNLDSIVKCSFKIKPEVEKIIRMVKPL